MLKTGLILLVLVFLPAPLIYGQSTLRKSQVEEKIQRALGTGVQVMSDRKPYFLQGDFNGDALEDLAVLVKIKQASTGQTPRITRLNPWGYQQKNSPGGSSLALAIIHGSSGSADQQVFLLSDQDFFNSPIWKEPSSEALISLKKKGPAKGKAKPTLPRAARGDGIAVATEAGIDNLLYWDGKTYKLFAPQEEP